MKLQWGDIPFPNRFVFFGYSSIITIKQFVMYFWPSVLALYNTPRVNCRISKFQIKRPREQILAMYSKWLESRSILRSRLCNRVGEDSHQQQFFSEVTSPRRSHKEVYFCYVMLLGRSPTLFLRSCLSSLNSTPVNTRWCFHDFLGNNALLINASKNCWNERPWTGFRSYV